MFLAVTSVLSFTPLVGGIFYSRDFTIEADSIDMYGMQLTLLDIGSGKIWDGAPTKTEANRVIMENVEIYRKVDGEYQLFLSLSRAEATEMDMWQNLCDALSLVPDIGLGDVVEGTFCEVEHLNLQDITISCNEQQLGSLEVQDLRGRR